MRHQKSGVKLNRTASHRKAMFRNMVTSLLKHDRIRTTDTKAKELRRWVDHIITLAKRGDLHARRQALSIVREKAVVHKLFEEASDRFGTIAGGYTRIVKIGRRPGDAAPMSLIELVSVEAAPKKKKKRKKAKPKVEQKAAAVETAAAETEDADEKAAKSETPDAAAPAEAVEKEEDKTAAEETAKAEPAKAAEPDAEESATAEPAEETKEAETTAEQPARPEPVDEVKEAKPTAEAAAKPEPIEEPEETPKKEKKDTEQKTEE